MFDKFQLTLIFNCGWRNNNYAGFSFSLGWHEFRPNLWISHDTGVYWLLSNNYFFRI